MVALLILLLVVILSISIYTAVKAMSIAEDKGYDNGIFVVILCIFLSPLLGILFVAAMPDKYSQENLHRIRTILEDMKASSEESAQDLVDIKELLADSLASKERVPKTKMKTKMRARAL